MPQHTSRAIGAFVFLTAIVLAADPAHAAPSCEGLTALTASPGGIVGGKPLEINCDVVGTTPGLKL